MTLILTPRQRFYAQKTADLRRILEQGGETVEYKTKPDLSALVTTPVEALQLDPGGIGVGADFVIKVMREDVAFSPPVIGPQGQYDRMKYNGVWYSIIRIGDRASYPALILTLKKLGGSPAPR